MDAIPANVNRCPTCAYDLSGQESEGDDRARRCPECGGCWTDAVLRRIALQREHGGARWGLLFAAPGFVGALALIACVVVTRSESGALLTGIGVLIVASLIIAWTTQGPAGTARHTLLFRAFALGLANFVIGFVAFLSIALLLAFLRSMT